MSEISEFIRKSFKEGDDKRDAGLTTPEDIIRYDNLLYGEDPKWQVLDVYRPRNREGEKLPVIVSVHGGGWVYGDKERYQYYCMDLAQRGFAVVNFTYRLAPEYQFPAPLEDTNSVFAWVLAHSEEYGLDKEKVFALGDSAGGNILGLYCALCTNKEYAGQFPFHVPEGFAPTAVALNCGDYVVVINAEKVLLTGKKKTDKVYVRHTGYPGGQRFATPAEMLRRKPCFIIEHAVKGMLPKTILGRQMFRNLHVFAGPEHPYQAQKPELINVKDLK